jgi:hypothetical protein
MKSKLLFLFGLLVLSFSARSQTLSFTVNQSTLVQGDSVAFTNTSTGFPGGQIYVWRFGDDCMTGAEPEILGCEKTTTGVGTGITHVYPFAGTYTATLMYQLSGGGFSSTNYTMTITVTKSLCSAPLGLNCSGGVPENLVVNGSFEFDQIPTSNPGPGAVLTKSCPWTAPAGNAGSPDLYGLDFLLTNNYNAGNNIYGAQVPQEGIRHAGFVSATANYNPNGCTQVNKFREYMQAPLQQALQVGKTYVVQFWVSLSDNSGKATPISAKFTTASGFGADQQLQNLNLGCIFIPSAVGPIINQTPDFTTPVSITEKGEWTLVEFAITPTVANLQFLTIGYFNDINNTGVTDLAGTQTNPLYDNRSYYYIDNVRVYESCCMEADYKTPSVSTNVTSLISVLGNPVVDQTIYVGSGHTLNINTNVTFQGCRFIMGANAAINVLSGQTLNITDNTLTFNSTNYSQKSYIYAGCNALWRSINVGTANSTLNLSNSCVNDALLAINAAGNTGRYNITNTVFDRNYQCVYISSGGNYSGTLNGNTFKTSYNILFPSYVNQVCQYGVKGFTTTNFNVGSPAFARNTFQGQQQSGTTVGLIQGVIAERSGTNVRNNNFIYLNDGVYTSNSPAVAGLTISVGNTGVNELNQITDCFNGVTTNNAFANINIRDNIFDFKTTGITYRGVAMFDPLLSTVNIFQNTFIDYLTGIFITNTSLGGTLLTINQNTFDYNITGPKLLRKGIFVNNVGFASPSTAAIFDNVVDYQTTSNSLISSCSAGLFDDCNYHGITLTNCAYIRVEDNRVVRSVAPNSAVVSRLNGIRTEASTNITVRENFNRSLGVSAFATGNCNPIFYQCNTGDNCWNQFRFNSATLSNQGGATQPWDNRWQNTIGTNKIEGTMSGSLINWYFRNNANNIITPIVVSPALILPSTLGGTPPIICNAPLMRLAEAPLATTGDSATKAMLLPIANNSIAYQYYPDATRYWALSKAYHALKGDATLRDENDATETALKILYVQLQNGNIGLADSLATLASLGDTLGFDELNNSIQPQNNIETLRKTVMGIYANTALRGHPLSADDIAVLEPIALSNPLWDGDGVYSARALLRSDFVNGEEDQNGQLRTAKVANVLVYPNPSNNQFFVSYNLGDENAAVLQVFDINGRYISSAALADNKGLYTIETNGLENGVYLYVLKGANGTIASGKLVLIK